MSSLQRERDLIVLVADKDLEFAVKGLLTRSQSLSTREVDADVYPHPQRDPGCARRCHDFLRAFTKQYRCALVLFDLDGSGYPGLHHTRKRRSSSLYFELAHRVSTKKCTDPAFAKLVEKLREWFPRR